MKLLPDIKVETIRKRGLIAMYIQNKTKFIKIARTVYQEMRTAAENLTPPGPAPTPEDIVIDVAEEIFLDPDFQRQVSNPHRRDQHRSTLADSFARYIIEQNWSDISKP